MGTEYDDFGDATSVKQQRGRGGRNGGASIDYPQLAEKLMKAYDDKKSDMLRAGANSIGVKLSSFCERIGRPLPNNVNSFKAGIQRQFDKISIDGRSVVLGYSNVVKGTFRPTQNTMILWRVVPSSERMAEDEEEQVEEVEEEEEEQN